MEYCVRAKMGKVKGIGQASIEVVESCEFRHKISRVLRVEQLRPLNLVIIGPEPFQTPSDCRCKAARRSTIRKVEVCREEQGEGETGIKV